MNKEKAVNIDILHTHTHTHTSIHLVNYSTQ